jgi:hypothetical protein
VIDRLESWYAVLAEVVNKSHTASADDLVEIISAAASRVGVHAEIYLADRPQLQLRPVRPEGGAPMSIDSTIAGRAFRLMEFTEAEGPPGERPVVWMPVLNGTERLGVIRLELPLGTDVRDGWLREQCWVLTGLVGHLLMTKFAYSDLLHQVRRPDPLSVPAELLWQLLPPQTFACHQLVVTATMEPYDQVGGDGYDYAVDARTAHLAVFDAVGHDIEAGLTCALALAATRNARRAGAGLIQAAALADEVIRGRFDDFRFATAVLAELDLETGVLSYLNAGHPPPVLLRSGRVVKTLEGPARPPLGLGHLKPEPPLVRQEQLEPGDRVLLHTDGVTEARGSGGEEFGLERLVDLTERQDGAGLPPPETLRRLTRAVLDHEAGGLQDDATLLLVEWTDGRPPDLLPHG